MKKIVLSIEKRKKNNNFVVDLNGVDSLQDIDLSISENIKRCYCALDKEDFECAKQIFQIINKLSSYGDNSVWNLKYEMLGREIISEVTKSKENIYDEKLLNDIDKYLNEISLNVNNKRNEKLKDITKEIKVIREEIRNGLEKNLDTNSVIKSDIEKKLAHMYGENFYNSDIFIRFEEENKIEDKDILLNEISKIYLVYKFNIGKNEEQKVTALYSRELGEFLELSLIEKQYVVSEILKEKQVFNTFEEFYCILQKNINKVKEYDERSIPL